MQALTEVAAVERIDTYSVLGLNERIVDGHDVDCVELNPVIYCQRVFSRSGGGPGRTYALRKTWEAELARSEEEDRMRLTIRPMRPKPLIPTRVGIFDCSRQIFWTASCG
jgi:hypothetical protein